MRHPLFTMLIARIFTLALAIIACARLSHAATLATFETTVGTMELELFDDDKPITVSNFVKYVTSGRYTNQFIQRWEPNFVIQGGGYRVTNTATGPDLASVPSYGPIKNEYSAGRTFSNIYGTIAMARQPNVVNSASSQWFLNLTNNAFLDSVDEGFTVFGRVTAGTNILNLFIPPPPTNGIYRVNVDGGALTTVPVLTNVTRLADLYTNLIYLNVKLRRDLGLTVRPTRPGQRSISWTTVAGVTNTLEYTTSLAQGSWTTYTNLIGTGNVYSLIDTVKEGGRLYRVKLYY